MTENEKIIHVVNAWQSSVMVHPLTCGYDSTHKPLIAKEIDGIVVLICEDCDYKQKHIPSILRGMSDGFNMEVK